MSVHSTQQGKAERARCWKGEGRGTGGVWQRCEGEARRANWMTGRDDESTPASQSGKQQRGNYGVEGVRRMERPPQSEALIS